MPSEIERKYKRLFDRMIEQCDDNKDVKAEIFSTLDTFDQFGSMFDLFVDKFVKTELEFAKQITGSEDCKINDDRESEDPREKDPSQ